MAGPQSPRRPDAVGGRLRGDDGAAVVEFVMVAVLLVFLLFGVIQVAAVFYVRNVISASAADAARYAASADVDTSAGGMRADELITDALSPSISAGIPCAGTLTTDPRTGLQESRVQCSGHIKSVFVPAGLFVSINVVAHSLKESR